MKQSAFFNVLLNQRGTARNLPEYGYDCVRMKKSVHKRI